MKVKVAIILLSAVILESVNAAQKNAYRISRSNRKKKESYDFNYDYDTGNQAAHDQSHDQGHTQQAHDFGGNDDVYGTEHIPVHHGNGGKNGYSEGSGLRSIAQGSADQANSAVQNQELAAKQASYIAQNNLANLALQASATANAALQGKQVLLSKIEQENLDAHQALENELQQLRQAKRSAKAAQQAASQALSHLQLLQTALNNAQTSSEHAQQAASEASAELASQTNMVGKAKQRVEAIEEQLHHARIDYDATMKAANDAQSSAQIAQNNAAEAAAKASLSSVHEISSGHGGSSYQGSEHGGSSYQGSEHGGSSYQGSEHGGHLDAYGSQKTLTVASANEGQQQASNHGGASSEKKPADAVARSSNISKASAQKSSESIASNHNYGHNNGKEFKDFKPSSQYVFAGY